MSLDIKTALSDMPIIAILRGLRPEEATDIGAALIEAGIRILEVPLNSPDPLVSISRLANAFSARAVIGAGTVLSPEQISQIADSGGRIAVSPNTNPDVIKAALVAGLIPFPGIFSPTDMFAASAAGAHYLKLFPADSLASGHVASLEAVKPAGCLFFAVGGIGPHNTRSWLARGVSGLGVGSSLYRPGDNAELVRKKADALVASIRDNSVPPQEWR